MKKVNLSGVYQNSIIRAGLILFIACAIGLAYNGYRKDGLPLLYREIDLNTDTQISIKQAYLFYRQGNVLFIDTRYAQEYRTGHIRSAINLPSRATIDEMMTFLETIDKNERVVVYCGSTQCNSARRLSGFMRRIGFTKVYVFLNGYEAWVQNDLPVNKNILP